LLCWLSSSTCVGRAGGASNFKCWHFCDFVDILTVGNVEVEVKAQHLFTTWLIFNWNSRHSFSVEFMRPLNNKVVDFKRKLIGHETKNIRGPFLTSPLCPQGRSCPVG
jgi:hypothetical protein